MGFLLQGMIHLHQGEVVAHLLGDLRLAGALHHLTHRQLHVIVDREPGQQGMVLEHHGPLWARTCHLAAIEYDAAGGGLIETGHQVQHCALAAAGVADERDKLSLGDLQIDVHQRLEPATRGGKTHADIA